MYRWIAYVWQSIPSSPSGEPARFETLDDVKAYAEQYSRDIMSDEICGMIYPYSDEDWELAMEFAYVGSPFDYPTKVIERGKRGALRIKNA